MGTCSCNFSQAHFRNTLQIGACLCTHHKRMFDTLSRRGLRIHHKRMLEVLSNTGALLVHSPQAQDRSHASSSLSPPKQQDTLKSATILFSGGSGRRDDTRNQNCAQDLYPALGSRYHCQCTNLVQTGSRALSRGVLGSWVGALMWCPEFVS